MVNGALGEDTLLVAEPVELGPKLEPVSAIILRHLEEEICASELY